MSGAVNPIMPKAKADDGLHHVEQAQRAIANMRGWSRHGAHDKAAAALDTALAALDAATAALPSIPYAAPAIAALRNDLNSLTSGA